MESLDLLFILAFSLIYGLNTDNDIDWGLTSIAPLYGAFLLLTNPAMCVVFALSYVTADYIKGVNVSS